MSRHGGGRGARLTEPDAHLVEVPQVETAIKRGVALWFRQWRRIRRLNPVVLRKDVVAAVPYEAHQF
jgi:hypothetical protein